MKSTLDIDVFETKPIISDPVRHAQATPWQQQHKVQRALLLDGVVTEHAAVLELLAEVDEALLLGGDALFVLNLALDHVYGVDRVHQLDDFKCSRTGCAINDFWAAGAAFTIDAFGCRWRRQRY